VAEPEYVEVRATVNMSGLAAGSFAWIDPTLPQHVELLEHGLIVRTGEASPADESTTVTGDDSGGVEPELDEHDEP
jgi:hypothetical protein